jgi:large subunit ribosomal protein L32
MAVPKRKTSKRRKRIRRSHHNITAPSLSRCSRCGATTRAHTVCDACGFYKGVNVLNVESEAVA